MRPTVAALDDARDVATALLLPLDAGRWLRLAVLAFLVGGAGGIPAVQGNLEAPLAPGGPAPGPGSDPGSGPGLDLPFHLGAALPDSSSLLALAAVLVAVALVLGLAYALAGAVAEFVLVVGLRDGAVRLRAPARDHLARGLRLFGFRLAVWVVAVLLAGLPALAVAAGVVGLSPLAVLLAVPAALFALVVLLVGWLVLRLTTDLAVPTMLAADVTPLAAWRRLLPTLRADAVETGVYLVVRVALGVAAGVATGLVAGLAALVAAVPFAVVGLVAFLLVGPSPGPLALVALGLLAVVYVLVAASLWVLVRVPVVVYLRAFSLATLGRLDTDLDVLGVAEARDGRPDDAAT